MSFAVRLDSAPQALHRRLWFALVAFALGASSLALAFAEPSQRGWIALAASLCFVIAFGRQRMRRAIPARGDRQRGRRRVLAGVAPAQGSLRIDDAGGASWSGANAGDSSRPARIERWNVLGRFAWLQLRVDGDAEALDVLFVRRTSGAGAADAAHEDDWRRLRAWLLWYGRGAAPADRSTGGSPARQ